MRRGRLRRRYGHGRTHHGPAISWQGTLQIESRYSAVQPALASAALGFDNAEQKARAIARGEELLSWLVSMKRGPSASARALHSRVVSDVRRLLGKARAR